MRLMEMYEEQLGSRGSVGSVLSEYIASSIGLQTALMKVLIKNNTGRAEALWTAEEGTFRTLGA